MKIRPWDYRYQVCPFCGSKKIQPVAVVKLATNQYSLEIGNVNRTGCICDNCKKYSRNCQSKTVYDRAEMKRDAKRLIEFLKN